MNESALVAADQAELARLEGVIERGARSFIEVGMALAAIRDARLYRDSHETFEAYCQERWSMSHVFAIQKIRTAQVSAIAETVNEAQARELAPLLSKMENGKAEKTIKKIVAEAEKEGPVTAKVLRVKVKAAMKKPDASPQAGIKLHESTETICPTCHGTGRVLANRRIPR